MRIAFLLPSLANTGPVIATRDLIFGIRNLVDEIVVYYFDNIVDIDVGAPAFKIGFFERIDYDRFDIVQTCSFRPDAKRWLDQFLGKCGNFASWIHCDIDAELKVDYNPLVALIFSPLWKMFISSANLIFVSSNTMRSHYSGDFPFHKFVVIPYGRSPASNGYAIPDEDVIKISKIKTKYKVIGSVASLTLRKGTEQIIEFLRLNTDYALISLGVGPELDNLKVLADKYCLEERVLFLGFRPDSRIYYQYFDIFCLPSRSEGFGLVVIDAMSSNTPMLLSNLPQYSDFLTSDDYASFELDNIESFSAGVRKIEINREVMIVHARAKYEKYFSIEQYALAHLAAYNSLM